MKTLERKDKRLVRDTFQKKVLALQKARGKREMRKRLGKPVEAIFKITCEKGEA